MELAKRASKVYWHARNLDTLAAAYAEVGRFEEAIGTQVQTIALLKTAVDRNFLAEFDQRPQRYKIRKPWCIKGPEDSPDDKTTATKLDDLTEQNQTRGKYSRPEPRQEQPRQSTRSHTSKKKQERRNGKLILKHYPEGTRPSGVEVNGI